MRAEVVKRQKATKTEGIYVLCRAGDYKFWYVLNEGKVNKVTVMTDRLDLPRLRAEITEKGPKVYVVVLYNNTVHWEAAEKSAKLLSYSVKAAKVIEEFLITQVQERRNKNA